MSTMKMMTVAGIALIVLGSFLLFKGGTFTSRREVLEVAGLSVTAEEQRPISPWIGAVVLLAGVGVVFAGARHLPST